MRPCDLMGKKLPPNPGLSSRAYPIGVFVVLLVDFEMCEVQVVELFL
jgi:hypothetical protein